MDLQQVLRELCLAPGVGGQTAAADVAARWLGAYTNEIERSPLGNVLGRIRCGKPDAPTVMLEAHIDQIGFVVTAVEDGFLRVAPCGGIDARVLAATEVVVYGDKPYPGVFASTPPHLAGDQKGATPVDKCLIDIGMTQEQVLAAVPVGSRVSFRPRFSPIGETGVTGTSLDDRSGVAAVLWAVDALAGEPLPVDVAVCFAVQEELGTRGAASGAFMLQPDAALAVDVSFALTPDANPRECGKLGEGPMIGIAPGLDAAYSRRLAALAEAQQIPFQREVMGVRTGTDADEISTTAHGVRTVLVSIPQRYMHTPVELVDMRDVENTGRLMAAFVREGVTA